MVLGRWLPAHPEPDFALEPEEQAYATAYKLDIAQMAWRRQKVVDDFRGDASFFDQEYPASPDVAFQRVLGRPFDPRGPCRSGPKGEPYVGRNGGSEDPRG